MSEEMFQFYLRNKTFQMKLINLFWSNIATASLSSGRLRAGNRMHGRRTSNKLVERKKIRKKQTIDITTRPPPSIKAFFSRSNKAFDVCLQNYSLEDKTSL